MTTLDRDIPRCALAIGAHPDDVEFGCGGTLAKWAAAGTEVHIAVLTDGSKGTWDPQADIDALVAARRSEQDAAALRLGCAEVHWCGSIDGELVADRTGVAAVCALVRRARPDVVLAHDPWRRDRLHPDHHAAGRLAVEGIVAARDSHFFSEQLASDERASEARLEPHRPTDLYLFESESIDHIEGIDGFVDAKIEALLAHRSQWRSTMGIGDDPEPQTARFAKTIRVDASAAGARLGMAAAEAFHRLAI